MKNNNDKMMKIFLSVLFVNMIVIFDKQNFERKQQIKTQIAF